MRTWVLTVVLENGILKRNVGGTSLVVQWLRLRLPMQGVWVRSLVWELTSHMPQGKKNKNKIKQKQNCNKFNKDFLKMAHVKKKKNLKINKNGKECGANKDGDWFSSGYSMRYELGSRLEGKVFEKVIHSLSPNITKGTPKYYARCQWGWNIQQRVWETAPDQGSRSGAEGTWSGLTQTVAMDKLFSGHHPSFYCGKNWGGGLND